jgi:hypothetical protein
MLSKRDLRTLMTGVAVATTLAAAGAAHADDPELSWSTATAQVGTCVVGVSCGQPGGVTILRTETFTAADTDFNNASVYQNDYSPSVTPFNYGMAYASAEAGEGLLGLPVLHALAIGGGSGFGVTPHPTIAVNVATVQGVQGYTNTSDVALLIPLNAFQGLVDYHLTSGGGGVGAGIAVTTDAILDPLVAAQWAATGTAGNGPFAAGCGTTGALAFGNAATGPNAPTSPNTQYLAVSASSCTGSDTFQLNPGSTFYVWARLGIYHAAFGATDALNTFNVTIAPEYQAQVQTNLAPTLARASGANLDIPLAVPEPGTWALMILGFGVAGAGLRHRRRLAAV